MAVALVGLTYSFRCALAQQNEEQIAQSATNAVNQLQIAELQKTVAEHQTKIEALDVAMAVVRSDSEQNNRILWGLLTGIVMLVAERVVGFVSKRRENPFQDE